MTTFSAVLRGVGLVAFLSVGLRAYTRSAQPPTGTTGAPGQSTCASCHSGTPVNGGGGSVVVTGIPATGYVPGTTYPVTVTVSDPAARRYGFELVVLDNANRASSGTMSVTSPTTTTLRLASGIAYMSHLNANGTNSWTFNWVAPSTSAGTLNLYVAANAANNNGSASGDHIYTAQLAIAESTTTAVADEQTLAAAALMVFPNPATDRLWLTGPATAGAQEVVLLDAVGREVFHQTDATADLDVRNLPAGHYTLRLTTVTGESLSRPVLLRQ